MKYERIAAAALLGIFPGAAGLNHSTPALFPHVPIPEPPGGSCPRPCSESGPAGSHWGQVHRLRTLDRCDKALLLDKNIMTPLERDDGTTGLRACTADTYEEDYGPPCGTGAAARPSKADVQLLFAKSSGGNSTSSPTDAAEGAKELAKNLKVDPTCQKVTRFAMKGSAIVGVFVGSEIRKSSVVPLVEKYVEYIESAGDSLPPIIAAQLCGPKGRRGSRHSFGIIADTTRNLQAVHDALGQWHNAECLDGLEAGDTWADQDFEIIPATAITMGARISISDADTISNATSNSTAIPSSSIIESLDAPSGTSKVFSMSATASKPGTTGGPEESETGVTLSTSGKAASEPEETTPANFQDQTPSSPRSHLLPRAECKAYEVSGGDDCWSIATDKCGLKNLAALYELNPGGKKMCDKGIVPGDHFCCTKGTMPDFSPEPNNDGTCKHVLVDDGDTCDTLAKDTCGITPKQFYEYNGGGKSAFCNKLERRQIMCCSSGKKPDLRPKKKKDGTCFWVAIKNKLCAELQTEFFLKDGDFDKFNKGKTWGWVGCNRLTEGQRICLSEGEPPMPASNPAAVCGPSVVGTQKPTNGTKVANLNQCPLNACCSTWGQCGTTGIFCEDTTVDDTPGTAKNGTDGCISNCGTEIVNNDTGPFIFSRVAYFEAWNKNRDCLHMDVTEIDEGLYTHIHFSFGTITDTFEINVKDVQEQFDKMVEWDTKLKKIISFGGWAFSTEPGTISVFRNGVKDGNREKFADNVVAFVNKHNLDGVDFDWEYPGADDIPGTTPGSPEDGPNYVKFLKLVRSKLAEAKSVSIAAPASYWYLRWFPMEDIGKIVDYIIYMTYDLHGQWDVNNEYSQPGCESGTCLRSHVNATETRTALSMITKAGVPSYKLFIGISSFGRSFKMAKEGCTGPMCKYEGKKNKSPAKEGECTDEGGYLADAEINQIILMGDSYGGAPYESFYDRGSDSNILVYDKVEWVAYMGENTKKSRADWYLSLNFGGVSDWAVDLAADRADVERSGDGDLDLDDFKPCDWDATYDSLEDLANSSEGMDPVCAAVHALRVLSKMLKSSMDGYDEAADGYDGKFDTYDEYIKKTLDERLQEYMREKGSPYFKCFGTDGADTKDEADELPCEDVDGTPGVQESWYFWYELTDKSGYEDSLWEFGVDPEWVEFGEYVDHYYCAPGTGACMDTEQVHHGFPRRKDDIEIPNPKEIVDEARGNLDKINSEFFAMEMDISLDQWDGSPEDAVQVLSAPVFMLSDAVASMEEVKEMGEEIEEAQETNLILTILSGVLFLIPFVGPVVGSLGRAGATIARLMSAVEATAAAGLSIYEIVEDPESAPFAILGMLTGGSGRGIGGSRNYRDLSKSRKNMKDSGATEKMGNTWKREDPHIQKLMDNSCRRR